MKAGAGVAFLLLTTMAQAGPVGSPESLTEIASKFGLPVLLAAVFIYLNVKGNRDQKARDEKLYDTMAARIRELEEDRVKLLKEQLEHAKEKP